MSETSTIMAVGDTAYRSTVIGADHRSARTQIFGGTAPEPQKYGPVEKRIFIYPICTRRPR